MNNHFICLEKVQQLFKLLKKHGYTQQSLLKVLNRKGATHYTSQTHFRLMSEKGKFEAKFIDIIADYIGKTNASLATQVKNLK